MRTRPRASQCELVERVLRDGRYHTAAEIHARCGFSRLNSRVAELRSRRGLNIVCEHIKGAGTGPDAYRYRLLGTSDEAAVEPSLLRPAASPGAPWADVEHRPGAPEQLTLGAVA